MLALKVIKWKENTFCIWIIEWKFKYINALINSFKIYDRNELEELTKQYYLENQELKKQLEEINNFINKANFANIEQLMLDYCAKTEEQKEFIQYLENCINKTDYEVNVLGNYKYLAWSNAYKNALTKYKEIIGDKEWNIIQMK